MKHKQYEHAFRKRRYVAPPRSHWRRRYGGRFRIADEVACPFNQALRALQLRMAITKEKIT